MGSLLYVFIFGFEVIEFELVGGFERRCIWERLLRIIIVGFCLDFGYLESFGFCGGYSLVKCIMVYVGYGRL